MPRGGVPVPPGVTQGSPRSAATVLDGSQYFVLLIITDGVISDMAQTKEAIVNVRPSWWHLGRWWHSWVLGAGNLGPLGDEPVRRDWDP